MSSFAILSGYPRCRGVVAIPAVSGAGAKDWDRASAYVASKAAMLRNVAHLHEAGFGLGLRAFGVAPGEGARRLAIVPRDERDPLFAT